MAISSPRARTEQLDHELEKLNSLNSSVFAISDHANLVEVIDAAQKLS